MHAMRLSDPDLKLSDLMTQWPQTIPIFLSHRMLCVGCLINPFHTVIDACVAYRLDEDVFRKELQTAIDSGAGVRHATGKRANNKA